MVCRVEDDRGASQQIMNSTPRLSHGRLFSWQTQWVTRCVPAQVRGSRIARYAAARIDTCGWNRPL